MTDVSDYMVRSLATQLQVAQMEVSARTEEVRILRRAQDEVGAMAVQLQQSNVCIEEMRGHMDRVARTHGMKMDPYVGWQTLLDQLSDTMRTELGNVRASYDKHLKELRGASEYSDHVLSARCAAMETEVQRKTSELAEMQKLYSAAQAETIRLTGVCREQARHMRTMASHGAVDPHVGATSLHVDTRVPELEQQLQATEADMQKKMETATTVFNEKLRLITADHAQLVSTLENEKQELQEQVDALKVKLDLRNDYFESTLKALQATLSAKQTEEREAAAAELNDALRQRDSRDKDLVAAREGQRHLREMMARSSHQLQIVANANTELVVRVKQLEASAAEAAEYRRANEELKIKTGQAELELMSIVERLRGSPAVSGSATGSPRKGKGRK